MKTALRFSLFAALAAASLGACTVEQKDGDADTTATAAQPMPAPAPMDTAGMTPAPASDLSIEVDVKARELHVMRAGQHVDMYQVAVGSERWPTQTGQWRISQVVFNPEWIPPRDESWTEDREAKDPGDPENPLGRVQLVYDLPRTIHGTNQPASIGKAVTHGSIRMRNADALALAKRVMEAAGVQRDSAWFRTVEQNRREKVVVDLPTQIPITVR